MRKSFWIHLIIFVVLLIVSFFVSWVGAILGVFVLYLLIRWAFQLSFFMKRKWNMPYWLTYGIGFVLFSVFLAVFIPLAFVQLGSISVRDTPFEFLDVFLSTPYFSVVIISTIIAYLFESLHVYDTSYFSCYYICFPEDIMGFVLVFLFGLIPFMLIGLIVGYFKKRKEEKMTGGKV